MLVLTETTRKVQCGGQSPGLKRTGQLRAVWVTVLMLMCSFPKYIFFSPSGSAFFCDCVGSLLLHGLSLVAASGGYSAVAVHWLLIAVASRCRAQALDHRPSSCGAQAWLLHSMQDLPGRGIKPMSPALAGGFFTTQPPGKPHKVHLQGSSQATVPSPTW